MEKWLDIFRYNWIVIRSRWQADDSAQLDPRRDVKRIDDKFLILDRQRYPHRSGWNFVLRGGEEEKLEVFGHSCSLLARHKYSPIVFHWTKAGKFGSR